MDGVKDPGSPARRLKGASFRTLADKSIANDQGKRHPGKKTCRVGGGGVGREKERNELSGEKFLTEVERETGT